MNPSPELLAKAKEAKNAEELHSLSDASLIDEELAQVAGGGASGFDSSTYYRINTARCEIMRSFLLPEPDKSTIVQTLGGIAFELNSGFARPDRLAPKVVSVYALLTKYKDLDAHTAAAWLQVYVTISENNWSFS